MRMLLLIMALNAGCAGYAGAPGLVEVDVRLQKYVDKYIDAKVTNGFYARGVNYKIRVVFGDLKKPNQLGVCRRQSDKTTRVIGIDPDHWITMDEDRRLGLVFHEMGHCDLDLDHGQGGPIMDAILIQGVDFRDSYDSLVKQLFGGY